MTLVTNKLQDSVDRYAVARGWVTSVRNPETVFEEVACSVCRDVKKMATGIIGTEHGAQFVASVMEHMRVRMGRGQR